MKPLTPKQEIVARYSMEGYSLREIAAMMRITPQAARSHRDRARVKMGVSWIRDATYDDLAKARKGNPKKLAKRQRQILQMLADGYTYDEIARDLDLSKCTIKNHVHFVIQKLDAANANQAIAEGFRRGELK